MAEAAPLAMRFHLDRVRAFALRLYALARDGTQGRWLRVGTIAGVSAVAATARGATLIFLAAMINALTGGTRRIPIVDVEVPAEWLVFVGAGAICSLQLAVALATYEARRHTRSLAREFHVRAARRMIDLLQGVPGGRDPAVAELHQHARFLVHRDALQMGQSLETLVEMLQPLIQVFIALAVAAHIDYRLTVLGLGSLLLLAPFVYRRSSHVNESARSYFQSAALDLGRTLGRYTRIIESGTAVRHLGSLGDAFIDDPTVRRFFATYDDIQLAAPRMNLVTAIFTAFVVGGGFLAIGHMTVNQGRGLGEGVAFMGAFIMLLGALQSLIGQLAGLQLYYPQISQYQDACARLLAVERRADVAAAAPLELRIAASTLPGSSAAESVWPGQPFGIVCRQRLTRSSAAALCATLAAASGDDVRLQSIDYAARNQSWPAVPVRWLLVGDAASDAELAAFLARFGLESAVAALPDGAATAADAFETQPPPPTLRALCRLGPLLRTAPAVLLLDEGLLNGISVPVREELWRALPRTLVFVVGNFAGRAAAWSQRMVVVGDDGIAGGGDAAWLEGVAALVRPLVVAEGGRQAAEFDETELL